MNSSRAVKRKLKQSVIAVLAVLWLTGFRPVNAAFEETAVSGKSAALGGIYVSACDDVNSIYHNPAGLALIPRAEFMAQYARLYLGLTDNSNLGYSFVGVAQPLGRKAGTLGIGWLRFELTGLYSEDTMILSYAKDVTSKLNLGVNAKYLKLAYGQDQYTMNALDNNGNATGVQDSLFQTYGNSKGNVDFDLGVQYLLASNYKLGLMIENLTEPNLALQSSVSAPLWRAYKIGLTHTGKTYTLIEDFMSKKFDEATTDWEESTAGEKLVGNNIALRGALNIGSRELVKISCGIGYKIDGFEVDYAIVYPLSGIQGTMGDHRISVLFRFGPVIRMADRDKVLLAQYNEEKQAHLATKKKLQEANQELVRLRRDLEEQLSRPAPVVPVVKEQLKPKLTPKTTAQLQLSKQEPQAQKAVEQNNSAVVNSAQYAKELNQYRKSAGELTIPQRLSKIDGIIKKYGPDVKVSEAQQERSMLVNEQKAQEKYFRDSLDYYRNMVKYGINKDERMDILKRMINKYKAMGIDVSEAQKEIDKINEK